MARIDSIEDLQEKIANPKTPAFKLPSLKNRLRIALKKAKIGTAKPGHAAGSSAAELKRAYLDTAKKYKNPLTALLKKGKKKEEDYEVLEPDDWWKGDIQTGGDPDWWRPQKSGIDFGAGVGQEAIDEDYAGRPMYESAFKHGGSLKKAKKKSKKRKPRGVGVALRGYGKVMRRG